MDDESTYVRREIGRALAAHLWASAAVVQAYDPTTHTAKVTLQPLGVDTEPLQIISPAGFRLPLVPGMTVGVLLAAGEPLFIVGAVYTDNDVLPAAPVVLPDGTGVDGALVVTGALTPGVVASLPPAGAAWAHAVLVLASTSTANAALYYCRPNADGSYAWVTLSATTASGTATVSAGTSVTVAHGLGATPSQVQVTPQANPGGAWWVSAVTSTHFTINLAASGTVSFYWSAQA